MFVFDTAILDALPGQDAPSGDDGLRADRRVEFIRESVLALREKLEAMGGGPDRPPLAAPRTRFPLWPTHWTCRRCSPTATTRPAALARDAQVFGGLANAGVSFQTFKDW